MLKITGPKTIVGWIVGALAVFGAIMYVNWFVYPFTSAKPNYSDVEKVYSKLVIPSDWVKKGEGSNKGIRGRQCPIESDGCFSKSGSFIIPEGTSTESIIEVYKTLGCMSVNAEASSPIGASPYVDFRCSAGPTVVSGTLLQDKGNWNININVSSR